jgi:histone-lysine N-methyltransferase SETMAR
MKKVCAKMVPKNLSEDQKLNREERCQNVLEKTEEDPDFLNSVITCDETWLFQYDPDTKRQLMQWKTTHSPRPKKAQMSKSKIKTMLVVFFDIQGIIMTQYVPPGQTMNQTYYIELLTKLRGKIRRKRPELWKNGWILHQDNALAHSALLVRQFLAKKQVPVLHHAPYSPDLAPCDFFLFPRSKHSLKGTHFQSTEDIQRKMTDLLKGFTQNDFQKCFHAWKERMQHCIEAQGNYFEGDNLQHT